MVVTEKENFRDISIWENIDHSGKFPNVGDRVRDYRQDSQSESVTHGKDGDWVVLISTNSHPSTETFRDIPYGSASYCRGQTLFLQSSIACFQESSNLHFRHR